MPGDANGLGGGGGGSGFSLSSLLDKFGGGLLGGVTGFLSGMGQDKYNRAMAKNFNDWQNKRGQFLAEGGGGPEGMIDVMNAIAGGQDPRTVGGLIGVLAQQGTNIFGPQKFTTQTDSTGTTSTSGFDRSRVAYNPEDKRAVGLTRSVVEQGLEDANSGFRSQVMDANRRAIAVADAMKGKERADLAAKGLSSRGPTPADRELANRLLSNEAQIPEQLRSQRLGEGMQWAQQNAGQNRNYGSTTQQTMSQLQTMMKPADFAMLTQLLYPQAPQATSAGGGWNTAGNVFGGMMAGYNSA